MDNKCETDGPSKVTKGRKIQNRSVAFLEDALDTNGREWSRAIIRYTMFCLYDPYLMNICYEHLAYHLLLHTSLRTFAYDNLACDLLPHTIFFLQSFAYELLSYDLFLYELLITIFWHVIFFPIRSFSHQHLLTRIWYAIFLFTNFCLPSFAYDPLPYTMLCLRTFPYEHLLTNFWHTNIRRTNFCPVTAWAPERLRSIM